MIIVQLAGHLGTDPEVRYSPSGQKITTLRIATNTRRQGKDETVWWRATIFGDHLDKMLSFLKKGSAVIVFGKMNPPTIYNDKAGQPQVSLEIIVQMIEFSPFGKSERSEQQPGGYQPAARSTPAEPAFAAPNYGTPAAYESPAHYTPQHQAPFAPQASHAHAEQYPEEDTIPF